MKPEIKSIRENPAFTNAKFERIAIFPGGASTVINRYNHPDDEAAGKPIPRYEITFEDGTIAYGPLPYDTPSLL